jgi:hypothetical protein
MFVTVINDCADGNTFGRQATRLATLFPNTAINLVRINNYSEIEAAGNLIDMLDASNGEEGVILVNSAPRHAKKWPNGTPFGYFWYRKTLVIATIDGYCLSLIKKLNLAPQIMLTDVPTVAQSLLKQGYIDKTLSEQIARTQFRSYDYMPRLARWVIDKWDIPYEQYTFHNVIDVPHAIWLIDNFGNAKTTILPEEINFKAGKKIKTRFGTFICSTQMRDVAVGDSALIIGSSGIADKRFIELIVLGGRAVDTFNLKSGDLLF